MDALQIKLHDMGRIPLAEEVQLAWGQPCFPMSRHNEVLSDDVGSIIGMQSPASASTPCKPAILLWMNATACTSISPRHSWDKSCFSIVSPPWNFYLKGGVDDANGTTWESTSWGLHIKVP